MPQPRSMPFWKQARLSFISSDQIPDALREWEPLTGKDDDDVASSVEGDTPATPSTTYGETSSSYSTPSRSSSSKYLIQELVRGSGLAGLRLDKEELRRRVLIPYRLLAAMVEAVRTSDIGALEEVLESEGGGGGEDAPESPLVVFVNSRSGGRYGPVLKDRLQDLIGRDQVFDLSETKPSEFVQYGLACLERLADLGDFCARVTRENLRVMVAGGDGTVGWVLGSLGQLYVENREPVPPVGIIPLGTGNDLSRSFGWGGSFPFSWRSAVRRSLFKAIVGPISRLDSWKITVSIPAGQMVELPHSLRNLGESTSTQDGNIEGLWPERVSCFDGVFYNYFSIGMDAQVAYSFHQLRDEKPNLANGPLANKLIYSSYSCKQGWFFTPCMSDPALRGLKNILSLSITKVNCSEWEQIPVPSSVRAIVALNLHSYGSGRNPWGNLKPEYLERRGFVEAHMDDGLLEIFGLKQGWHASLVMVELISAKHIAQASAIRLEIRGGELRDAFMQMDGEPWKVPISDEYSSFVEITRVPYQSLIINGVTVATCQVG